MPLLDLLKVKFLVKEARAVKAFTSARIMAHVSYCKLITWVFNFE